MFPDNVGNLFGNCSLASEIENSLVLKKSTVNEALQHTCSDSSIFSHFLPHSNRGAKIQEEAEVKWQPLFDITNDSPIISLITIGTPQNTMPL
jgi:hypothetical protein